MLGRAAVVAAHDYMTLGGGAPVPPPSVLYRGRPDPVLQEGPSGFTRRAAPPDRHQLIAAAVVQEDSLKKLMLAGLVAVLGSAAACAAAEAQREKNMVVGQVQSVDETRTVITLTDGTKLLTPPGSIVRPGALEKGTQVIAMYREENGDKILTDLALGHIEPAPSTPSESPKRY
jgi:hypothetical protein